MCTASCVFHGFARRIARGPHPLPRLDLRFDDLVARASVRKIVGESTDPWSRRCFTALPLEVEVGPRYRITLTALKNGWSKFVNVCFC